MPCITVEVKPRFVKQYKCHHCCSCTNYWGKGMESGKKKTRIHLTYVDFIEPCFGIGHNLSLICQMTSEDIKHQLIIITVAKGAGIAQWLERRTRD